MKKIIAFLAALVLTVCGLLFFTEKSSPQQSEESLPAAPVLPKPGEQSALASSAAPDEGNPLLPSRAEEIFAEMSLEEKVGQLFFVRVPKTEQLKKLEEYHLGGYLLFGRDTKEQSKEQLAKKIAGYQQASSIPLFIGVDEEGGTVCRVSGNPLLRRQRFASPRDLYRQGGIDELVSDSHEKSALLSSLGINVNFAPVCDLSASPDDFIYSRTLGEDAAVTEEYIQRVVQAMAQDGMGSVLKHFPGYGSNKDTHTGITLDKRPYEQFEQNDFLPFLAGINAGAEMVMVSHNIVYCMDGDFPASLSPKVHEILRDSLQFKGIIITDDLYMDAIGDYTGRENAAVLAVKAGNDMLCCTDFEVQIPAVIQAVQSGEIAESVIDSAVLRVLRIKERLGLIQ